MKKLIALMLALVMSLSLVACGGGDDTGASTDTNTPAVETTGADIQPAIDAFNAASDAFDAVANEVNANIDIYSQELIDTMIAMSDSMTETKTLLESNPELTEEKVQELVAL
jgi:ABC-type glycerol-3-phosphate transport system substrate-binding protein